MQTASVIGREFAFRILQAVAILKEDLKSSLHTLQDLEFIYEKSLFPELEYIFKHALTQEVAYNSLLIKKRKETHERVGQAIEQIYADRLDEFYEMLAYHYSLSENNQKAYEFLKLAGDKASRNYANWEAIKFYREAIRVLDAQPENAERKRVKIQLILSIINTMWILGYPEGIGAQEVMQEAERLAKEISDESSLTKIYSKLGHYHAMKGSLLLGIEYSEKCFNLAEKIKDIDVMVLVARDVCAIHFLAGNYSKVVDLALRALRLLEEHHREKDFFGRSINMYSDLSGYCGHALGLLGKFEEGKDLLEKGLRNALEVTNDKWAMGWVEFNHSALSFFKGDSDATIYFAQQAIKHIEEASVNPILGSAWILLGGGYYLLGDFESAKNHSEKGLKVQKEVGVPVALPLHYWFLSLIHSALGDLEQARVCTEEGLRLAKNFNTRGYEGLLLIMLGSIKGKLDLTHMSEAQQQIRKGITILEELRLRPLSAIGYLLSGELFADAGRREEAMENLKKEEALYLEMEVTPKSYWLKRTQEALGIMKLRK